MSSAATSFQSLTDGNDQNIGNIDDSIAEFFNRSEEFFKKIKRRELGLGKRDPLPEYKRQDFPCWLYRGGVDPNTGDPKVSSILVKSYPDLVERGYPVPESGLEKSREEKDRKLALGYHDSPADAEQDAEDAAIAFRQRDLESGERAKLEAVKLVWGAGGPPAPQMPAPDQSVIFQQFMDRMAEMERELMELRTKPHEHEAKPVAPPLAPKGK